MMGLNAEHKALRAALALLLLAAMGCATAHVPPAPPPEDEVARLQRNITKVRFAIDSTRELIDTSRGQAYLPDLHLRLAELYVEEARYHYFIAYEGNKRRDKAVTSVQARLLKERAISAYERILQEFPDYAHRDKVLFFIAHEFRELGEFDRMREYLERIATGFPQSAYRNEALLVLGDHHFDKSELPQAQRYYQSILASAESPSHAMARYKLAWVRINEVDFRGALALFEETIEKLLEEEAAGVTSRRIDLRREALVDLVFPYTEVHKKPVEQLAFFRKLADSRTTYLAALSKLGRRWFVKGEFALAGQVYRELLTLGADDEDSVSWAQRLYDGVTSEKKYDHVAHDVELVTRVYLARRFDWRIGEKERGQLREEFEAYARDLGTKAQLAARTKNDARLFAQVGDAYDVYLEVFGDAPQAPAIRQNLAEVRFAAGQHFLAGRAWESLLAGVADQDRQTALAGAVSSYGKALEKAAELRRLEQVQARAGLRTAGRQYIAAYPKARDTAAVKFALARTYYDEGRFEESAELFAALVLEFPTTQEGEVAAELALDSLRSRGDYAGMIQLARRMGGDQRLPPKVRGQLAAISAGAESRALETVTLAAGSDGEGMVDGLLDFAKDHPGSNLGERALVNAFVTARNSDDLEQVVEVGDRLLGEYPGSEAAPEVLASLGRMSAQAADFERAASYLARAAEAQRDPAARLATLRAAGTLQAWVGDQQGARKSFDQVLARANDTVRRESALAYAELLEMNGDWRGSAEVLARAKADDPVVAWRRGRALRFAGSDGSAQFARAATANSADPAVIDAAAGSRFYLADGRWSEFASIRFGSDRAGDGQVIQRKFAALASYEEGMVQVIETQSARWSLASLGRMARAYAHAATFLEEAPIPSGDAGDRYRAALATRAEGYRAKAQEAIATCAGKAMELEIFDGAARACLEGKPLEGDPEERFDPPARQGQPPQQVASALRSRIAKDSKDFEALVQLATLHLQAGDPWVARLIADSATEGGADSATFNLRGVIAHRLGQPQVAFESFRAALGKDEGNVRARLNLAALYRAYGYDKLADAQAVKVDAAAATGLAGDPALLAGATAEVQR